MDDSGYSVVNSHWCEKYLSRGQVNYFGRLDPNDINNFWYVYFELEQSEHDERLPEKFSELGISGKDEWGAIWAGFYHRHFWHLGPQEAQEKFLITMAAARNRQHVERQQRAAAGDPGLTAPVDGVTIEMWAQAAATCAQIADVGAQERALAGLGMDRARYERANAEFMDRMQRDTTFVIATIYGQAFSGALGVQGGYQFAPGSDQNLGQEPVSFDRYAEINGAMAAWSAQGHDVNAMLGQTFGISALDLSAYGGYWSTKFSQDPNLAIKHVELCNQYQARYGGGGGSDSDLSF